MTVEEAYQLGHAIGYLDAALHVLYILAALVACYWAGGIVWWVRAKWQPVPLRWRLERVTLSQRQWAYGHTHDWMASHWYVDLGWWRLCLIRRAAC